VTAPDAATLEAAVWAEDAALVRELLRDATEGERRVLAKALKPLLEGPKWELPKPVVFDSLEDGMAFIVGKMAETMAGAEEQPTADEQAHDDWWQLTRTPAFAAFAVGVAGGRKAADNALNDCHGRDWHVADAECEALAGVLADRNPPWLAGLVEGRLTARVSLGLQAWPLARWLVRLGAIERPAVPEYGASMVRALAQDPPLSPPLEPGQSRFEGPEHAGPRREMAGTGGDRLALVLLGDPGLLEHEIWRLFTDPGVGKEMAGRDWVTSRDQLVVGDQWTEALVSLAAGGHLDRGRLIDECLDAFLRDFPPNHVGWYASLHDRLAPSPDEAAARSPRYLSLLAANSKPGVSLGQRACAGLLDAGRLEPAAFLAASGSALLFPQKSVATAQLKLIGKLAASKSAAGGPSVRELALATAAQAFAHQREDVQSAALKLTGKHGLPADAALRATVIDLAAALSPVLEPDAKALGLIPSPPSPSAASFSPVPSQSSPQAASSPATVVPVADPDELVQLLAQLMEDATDAIAVERALAGAVRLAALPLEERARLAAPLLTRARKQSLGDLAGPFSGYAIHADMGWLALTWATGELPPATTDQYFGWPQELNTPWQSRRPVILSGILSARIGEGCTLIASRALTAGRAVPLLAEPELSDGTISPGELAARKALWAAAGLTPLRYDQEVAHLRAAPGADEELAFEPFVTLQAAGHRPSGWTYQDWLTEDTTGVRARLPRVPESASAPVCWALLTRLTHSFDNRRNAVFHDYLGVRLDEMIAAWQLLCPHEPELLAAHLLSPLSDGLGPGRNAATTALRGLGLGGAPSSTAGPFGKIGHLALVTGLSGEGAEVRIAAADAWTRMALSGRLDPALAAEAVSLGVSEGALKLSRIADGLRHVAAEPAAAAGVAHACVSATAALLVRRPAGLHLLLEVAVQASAISGVPELPGSVTDLAARGGSKLAEAARRLAAR
jgi:Family of unknown function (DUF6493)